MMNVHANPKSEQASSTSLGGLIAFLITPTDSSGNLDENRLCGLADEVIAGGVDAITLFGSTGAIGSFNEVERLRAAETLLKHVSRRVPVMIGTGAMTTAETIRLSTHAEEMGASAVLVVPITYWLLNEDELASHYKALGNSIGIPICVYNNPRLTGVDMSPQFIVKLAAEIPNVKYVKESSPELVRVSQTKRLLGERIQVFAGRDNTAVEALRIGAGAWTSGVANFCPDVCRTLFDLTKDPASSSKAWDLSQHYMPLFDFCMARGLVRTCHTALQILGRSAGDPRAPLKSLSGSDRSELETLLRKVGIK